jgi:hypothetical protein
MFLTILRGSDSARQVDRRTEARLSGLIQFRERQDPHPSGNRARVEGEWVEAPMGAPRCKIQTCAGAQPVFWDYYSHVR